MGWLFVLHEVDPTLRTMGQQKVSTNLGTKQIIGATLLFSFFFFFLFLLVVFSGFHIFSFHCGCYREVFTR